MDLTTAFNSMWNGYKADFANPMLAKLLNRGGITSMLDIAALVIFACGLGGMLRHIGIIDVVLEPVARRATSGLSLVLATLFIGYAYADGRRLLQHRHERYRHGSPVPQTRLPPRKLLPRR